MTKVSDQIPSQCQRCGSSEFQLHPAHDLGYDRLTIQEYALCIACGTVYLISEERIDVGRELAMLFRGKIP